VSSVDDDGVKAYALNSIGDTFNDSAIDDNWPDALDTLDKKS
jgi:hypothetical protein